MSSSGQLQNHIKICHSLFVDFVAFVVFLPLVREDTFKLEMSAFQSESKWSNLLEILLLMKLSSIQTRIIKQFSEFFFFIQPHNNELIWRRHSNQIFIEIVYIMNRTLSDCCNETTNLVIAIFDQIGWKWRCRRRNLGLVETNLQIWNRCQFGKFSASSDTGW